MIDLRDNAELDLADAVIAESFASRSDAVRLGLIDLVRRYRRQQVGNQIVEGYRAKPQSGAEVCWADAASVQMIADEPW